MARDRGHGRWAPAVDRPPHRGPITALTALHRADGRAVLVSGSNDDGVRRWNALTGEVLDDPLDGRGWVWAPAATGSVPTRTAG